MSVIISPIITNAGLGVFTPMATGIEFTFTHVAVGTGTSAATAAATALENEIARFPIAGGGIVTGGQAVSINALITNHANANPQDYDITEFGFYGVDSNSNTVLFAIYRTNTPIVSKVSGADISAPFVMGLAALPTNNMTVQIDTNTSQTLALMGQHTAANHPHTQYKRTLDNTERLKIATAVDADDAVSKGQLDAFAVTHGLRNDISANSTGGADLDSLVLTGKYWIENNNPNRPFDYGILDVENLSESDVMHVMYNRLNRAVRYGSGGVNNAGHTWQTWQFNALLNGNSGQVFKIADGVDADDAVSKGQVDAVLGQHVAANHPHTPYKRTLDNTERLKIADAVDNDDAVSKAQLIAEATARENADTNLQNTKANLGGSNTQRFKIADGVDNDEAVRKSQLPIQATDSVVGISREATAAEVLAGALSGVFISPDNLSSAFPASDTTAQLSMSLPNGYIIKMGYTEYGELPSGVVTVPTTFTNAFPSDCLFALANPYNPNLGGQMAFICTMRSWSDVGISVDMVELSGSGDQFNASYVWFAIGK